MFYDEVPTMKQFFLVFTLFCLSLIQVASAQSIFPDKNLENVVRKYVFEKRNTDQPIVEQDVANIALLEGPGKGIASLAGLEKCKSLALINLKGNEIADISALKEL